MVKQRAEKNITREQLRQKVKSFKQETTAPITKRLSIDIFDIDMVVINRVLNQILKNLKMQEGGGYTGKVSLSIIEYKEFIKRHEKIKL